MIDVRTVSLPTHFEKSDNQENDSRFQKVKIYIAHTGENLNHSIFSHDVLEQMIPSLANIPILGYVGVNDENDEDFRGHEKRLSIDDGKFKVSFETHAYGFVPVDSNAHFEVTGGKEWLVTDGYLWTRFVDAMELFDESNGSKGQSMEISNAEGYTDDRGRMVFTNATFTGLCILGNDVPPAMTGSTISTVFSKEDFKSTFEEMLAEFSAEKGEYALATKKKQKDEAAIVKEEDKKPASSSTASEPGKAASSATSSASKPAEKPASDDKKESAKPAPSTPKEDPKPAAKPAPSATPSAAPTASSAAPSATPSAAPTASSAAPTASSAAPTASSATPSGSSAAPSAAPTEDKAAADEHEDEATMSVEKDDDKGISLPENESAYVKDKDDKDDDDPEDDSVEDEDDDSKDKKKFACGDGKKKHKVEFELSLNARELAFIDAVRSKYGQQFHWIFPESTYEDYGIVQAEKEEFGDAQYFRIEYSVNADDSIKLGDKTEVFPMYVTQEEKNKIESDRVKLSDLEEQIKQLTAYKAGIEMQAKEKSLNDAKDALTSDQVKNIKDQFEAKTPEEIEKEIAFAIYTSHKEEVMAPSRGGVKAINFSKKDDYGYGSANELFHK